jgi:hypothetical protein
MMPARKSPRLSSPRLAARKKQIRTKNGSNDAGARFPLLENLPVLTLP